MGMRSLGLLALSGLLALALSRPDVSLAGYYEVSTCTESVSYVNNSWHLFDSNSSYLEANTACHQTPTHELSPGLSNLAVGDVLGAGDPPVGAEAGWRFTAPVGTAISEVIGSDDLFKDTNNDWHVYLENANNEVLGGQTCIVELRSSFYCEVSGPFQESGISTPSVAIGVVCTQNNTNNCPGGATIHEVRAELDYATVTIRDEVLPTGIVGSRIPPGPQHGTVSILGSAEDATSGLLSLSVVNGANNEVIGGPVTSGSCDYSFTTPCPTKAENLSIPIDTTKLPNGLDQIRVEATNAAHDEGFSSPYTLDVENDVKQGGGGGGGSSSGGGSKTGGSGGSGTQTGSSGSSSGSGSSTSTGGSTTVPIPVAIHLDKVRRTVTSLLISGHLKPAITGTVTLTLWHTGSMDLIRDLHLAVAGGRFRVRIPLARRLRRRHLTVDVSYPGGPGYLHANRIRVVSPIGPLLR